MSPIQEDLVFVDCETVSETFYDAVIVGYGVAGAIVAKQLSQQGKKVLILRLDNLRILPLQAFKFTLTPSTVRRGKTLTLRIPKTPML